MNIFAAPFDALAYSGMQINGSMDVSQELGQTGTSINGNYVCDGWRLYWTGSTMTLTASQVLNATVVFRFPFLYAHNHTGTPQPTLAASDLVCVLQRIEGWRIKGFAWGTPNVQPLTIGFWSAHNTAGLYSGSVRNTYPTIDRSFVFSSIRRGAGGVPQYNVITIPGCTDSTWSKRTTPSVLIFAFIVSACGSTNIAPSVNTWLNGNYIAAPGQYNGVGVTSVSFRMTGVVVLPGIEAPSAARSPLIMRPFDQELLTCQRYYQKNYAYATLPGANIGPGVGGEFWPTPSGTAAASGQFRTRMRAEPAYVCG